MAKRAAAGISRTCHGAQYVRQVRSGLSRFHRFRFLFFLHLWRCLTFLPLFPSRCHSALPHLSFCHGVYPYIIAAARSAFWRCRLGLRQRLFCAVCRRGISASAVNGWRWRRGDVRTSRHFALAAGRSSDVNVTAHKRCTPRTHHTARMPPRGATLTNQSPRAFCAVSGLA